MKSVSRFARNSLECLEAIRKLMSYGVTVLFENDNIDTKTMNSELVFYVKSAFAQSESLAGSKRVSTAIRMKMENGEFTTYTAPYGYKLVNLNLVIEPNEAEVVRRIFSMYLQGLGTCKIAAELNMQGIDCKGHSWTVTGVRYILSNEKYIGDSIQRCINRIENGQDSCDAIGVDEQKLHNAICRCLSKMFDSKNEALNLMKSNLTYAVSGNESALNAFAIESQIESLNGDMDRCCEMRLATSGDIGRFDEEIKKISEQLVELRKQLDLSRVQMSADEELTYEVNRISDLFANTDTLFSEYDDVTVRRLVECIRVMKDRRIIVILKGGVQAEESF